MEDVNIRKGEFFKSIFINWKFLSVTLCLFILVFWLSNPFKLNYVILINEDFEILNLPSILGMLFLLSFVIERSVETMLNIVRGDEIVSINEGIQVFNKETNTQSDEENRVDDKESDESNEEKNIKVEKRVVDANDRVAHKKKNKSFASFWSLLFGLMVGLSGFNILSFLFEVKTINQSTIEISVKNDFDEAYTSFVETKLDKVLFFTEVIDSSNVSYVETDLITDELIPLVNAVNSALVNIQENEIQAIKSLKLQKSLFNLIGVLLTALMLSGGSNSVHLLLSFFDNFMTFSKERFETNR